MCDEFREKNLVCLNSKPDDVRICLSNTERKSALCTDLETFIQAALADDVHVFLPKWRNNPIDALMRRVVFELKEFIKAAKPEDRTSQFDRN